MPRPFSIPLCIALAFFTLPPMASLEAQPPAGEADALFRSLDTNRDGKLTNADGTENNRRMLDHVFEMAGKAPTGTVTRAEFQEVFERHRAGRNPAPAGRNPDRPLPPERSETPEPRGDGPAFPAFLQLVDANRDLRLSRTEWNRLTSLFERLDRNRDGSIDAEELRAAETTETRSPDNRPESRPPESGRATDRGGSPEGAPSRTGEAPSGPARTTTSDRRNSSQPGSRLIGVWRGWVVEGRGETPNSGQMEIELTIDANQITGRELGTRRAPGGIGGGTYVMTGNGTSGNLDADGTSGPQDGRHFMGIYELDGDTLKWCVANRGRQRPQVMATDRGNYLLILQRQARN